MSINDPFPLKSWGQHFLKDQKIIQKIVQDCPAYCQAILEVGAGMGALTEGLSKLPHPLVAIERDRRFQKALETFVRPDRLIMADALKVDYEKIAQNQLEGRPLWLVSNLPYQISAPLMVTFFSLPFIQFMTLMMQKEVGQKICPPEGSKNSASSLMALGQSYFSIKKLTSVSPGAFFPPPQVDSVVLSFQRIERPSIPPSEFSSFERFVRRLFAQKRKQMLTVLSPHYGRGPIQSFLETWKLSPTLRAEGLRLHQVQTLFKHLHLSP